MPMRRPAVAEPRVRLDQPRDPRRRGLGLHYDPEAFGKSTERIARFLGTGRYLVLQSILIALWLIYNIAAPRAWRFDPYTFTFLTLILSLQAAYAAPLILLAQNRQDDRDRVNLDEDRGQAAQSKADVEYLAREIAAIRIAVGEVATRDFLRAELSRLEPRDGRERRAKPEKAKSKAREKLSTAAAEPGSHRALSDMLPLSEPSDFDQPVDLSEPLSLDATEWPDRPSAD
ncbi:MAG: hypothetical protein JWN61_3371 [Pseudonocardiales bacterium]|nr:hypothetical protein [Pseudonocardiales bacterium]